MNSPHVSWKVRRHYPKGWRWSVSLVDSVSKTEVDSGFDRTRDNARLRAEEVKKAYALRHGFTMYGDKQ